MGRNVSSLQDPRERLKDVNRQLEENAQEMRRLVEDAEKEQRSDLSRRDSLRFQELETAQVQLHADHAELSDEIRSSGGRQTNGASVREDRDSVLLEHDQRLADTVPPEPTDDFDERELRSFSIGAYVRGMVTGNWDGAAVERRALSIGTATAGGHLIPTPIATGVIDRVRNQARVVQAGARTVAMDEATLALPRLTTGITAAWRNENAAVAESDPAFDRVTLSLKTLAVLTRLSYELFQDLTPAGAEIIERELIQSLAVELDRVALRGTGTAPEPRGVLNTVGVTVITNGVNGTAFGWAQVVNLVATVQALGFDPNAIIANPRALKSAALLIDTTNQPLVPPTYASNVPILPTMQVPINLTVGSSSDTSELYTGQWDQMVIGFRPQVSIEVQRTGGPGGMIGIKESQERYMDSMQVGVLAYLRADIALLHPEAFAVSTGIRP